MKETLLKTLRLNNRDYLKILHRTKQTIVDYVASKGNNYEFKKYYGHLMTRYSNETFVIRRISVNRGIANVYSDYNYWFYLDDFDLQNLNKIIEALSIDE